MSLTAHQRFEIKKFLKELEGKRGRHTELVSVWVPAGYDLIKVIQQLQDEQGTAANIKSSTTRNNVQDALERMIQHLRVVSKTPKNGLLAFSGNVAEREGASDVRVWSIEPPVPINQRLYRCDKDFKLDILQEMLATKEVYGLVVMDARDATIGVLKGKTILTLLKTHSEVPGKMKAGGQSAHRFQQNRELAAKQHYKKVADYMKDQFLTMENLKGILVGGPGPTKYEMVDGDYITNEVKKKILAVKDIAYTDEFGLNELTDRAQDVLAQEEIADEKKIMGRFFELLATKDELVIYGEAQTRKALELGKKANIKYLAQGTIYPDRIESAQASKAADKIKSHHNLTLPEKMNLLLIEPLKELYKDEVRALGEMLGLPHVRVWRQPFPGPGLAIRIVGEVTPERVGIVREADHIFRDEILKAHLDSKIWQYFAALLPVKSVGVMADERTYEYIITLRAVTSKDGMTADWAKIPFSVMERISTRISNDVRGVNRVVYDVSQKPPATIEYE